MVISEIEGNHPKMLRNKPWLLWGFVLASVIATWANLTTERGAVFEQGNGQYNINNLVEERHWVESAPIVLTNHFSTVDVFRLGNPQLSGISFSPELVRIFKVRHVDTRKPLDIRPLKKFAALQPLVQYESNAACHLNDRSGSCRLFLIWDASNSSPNREFVNARVGNASFALIDSNVLRNVVGVTKW